MTEIYLIRHTQAEGNVYRVMQGHWDGDVTPLGLKEIDALAERFRETALNAVYSSDLYRAMLTAAAVTRYNGLETIPEKRFRELDMGAWEGQFFGNASFETPEAVELFLSAPWKWHMDGAETLEQVAARACKAMTEIAERHEGQTVAVVTHGITIRCLLTKLLNFPVEGEKIAPIVKNTAVSKLIYQNGHFTAEYLNDVSHLGNLPVSDWVQRDALRHMEYDPETDPNFYQSCYKDAWCVAHNGELKGFRADPYFQSAVEHYRKNNAAVLKFYRDDVLAGMVDLDTERGMHAGYGWISLLYLRPEFRNRGYGIQALSRAIMLYYKMGMRAIRLNVAASNKAAVRFYEKNMFRVIGSESGVNGPVYLMERSLGRIS